MDNYIVSARKYRPSTFKSVVGQKALTATLKNSIESERLAHAYLFCGSRGVGKTSCARIFAKTINCQHRTADGDACNECQSCREFNEGRSMNIVELDAASNNSVDDIRALVDQVLVPPTNGRYRVFIVDEVHMLSSQAFNAFLKTLEEPPEYVVFILATTEKHKIIPTILSRCQIYDFNRITIQDMIDHLSYVASQEGITVETAALNVIARKADGAMRDALSIFDQVAASSMGNITYESTIENLNVLDNDYYGRLLDAFLSKNVPDALLLYKEIRDRGFDSLFFINGLAAHFRDLMVAREPATLCLLEASDDEKAAMASQAQRCSVQYLYQAMDLCNKADLDYRAASNKQFLVELLLIKLCQQLSPSPNNGGNGEGQLKKIETVAPTVAPATVSRQQPGATPVVTTPPPATYAAPVSTAAEYPSPDRVVPPVVSDNPAPTISQSVSPGSIPPPPPTPRRIGTIAHTAPIRSTKSAEESQTVVRNLPKNNKPYTQESLDAAWLSYIQGHASAHILVNTMRTAFPKRIRDNVYELLVENPAQKEVLEVNMIDIKKHLSMSLGNDFISFEISLNDGEPSPQVWSERKVLNHIAETTPYYNTFAKDLKLSLM